MNTVADRESAVNVAAMPSWPHHDGKPASDGSFQSCHYNSAVTGGRSRLGCRRGRAYMIKLAQSKIYNFLERPTGWKCFVYHFTV